LVSTRLEFQGRPHGSEAMIPQGRPRSNSNSIGRAGINCSPTCSTDAWPRSKRSPSVSALCMRRSAGTKATRFESSCAHATTARQRSAPVVPCLDVNPCGTTGSAIPSRLAIVFTARWLVGLRNYKLDDPDLGPPSSTGVARHRCRPWCWWRVRPIDWDCPRNVSTSRYGFLHWRVPRCVPATGDST